MTLCVPDLLETLAAERRVQDDLRAEVARLQAELEKTRERKDLPAAMTPEEAARYIGVKSARFLKSDRESDKPKIPWSRPSHKVVIYQRADLDAYLKSLSKKAA